MLYLVQMIFHCLRYMFNLIDIAFQQPSGQGVSLDRTWIWFINAECLYHVILFAPGYWKCRPMNMYLQKETFCMQKGLLKGIVWLSVSCPSMIVAQCLNPTPAIWKFHFSLWRSKFLYQSMINMYKPSANKCKTKMNTFVSTVRDINSICGSSRRHKLTFCIELMLMVLRKLIVQRRRRRRSY